MFLVIVLQKRDGRVQEPAGRAVILQNFDEMIQSIIPAVVDAWRAAVLQGEGCLPKSSFQMLNVQDGHGDAERYIVCGYLPRDELQQAAHILFTD